VTEIADGVARVSGLPGAWLGEVPTFPGGRRGFALALEPDAVATACSAA
jgi:F-type H+-transporting ATPase subunit alpha